MSRRHLLYLAILLSATASTTVAAADDANLCFNGRGEASIAACTRAINAGVRRPRLYTNRGWEYRAKGDYDRALADLNQAIRLSPKDDTSYIIRGHIYEDKNDNDRALADYDEALRIDAKNIDGLRSRGILFREKRDYQRALVDFNEIIRLEPDNANAYVHRGLTYEGLDDTTKARVDFNTALRLPNRGMAWTHDTAQKRLSALPTATPEKSSPAAATPTPSEKSTDVVLTVSVPNGENRVALVIGNSNYENVSMLPNPERDAKLVAEALTRAGFQSVSLLSNLRKDALVEALRSFAARAEAADWAVIYYAGHGMEVAGVNYLIPTDAKIAADRDIGFEAVPLEQVLNAAERSRKLRLVILDACRDNPFLHKMRRTLTVASRSVSQGFAAVEPEAGTLVVYAAKDGETALDGDGVNSPFTAALVKNLAIPGLEVRRLFDFVRDDVMEATNNKQKPFSYGSISGRQDFYFVPGK